jgi:hypothetical protein
MQTLRALIMHDSRRPPATGEMNDMRGLRHVATGACLRLREKVYGRSYRRHEPSDRVSFPAALAWMARLRPGVSIDAARAARAAACASGSRP